MAKKCVKCSFDRNPDDAAFCGKCGSAFSPAWDWEIRYDPRTEQFVDRSEYVKMIIASGSEQSRGNSMNNATKASTTSFSRPAKPTGPSFDKFMSWLRTNLSAERLWMVVWVVLVVWAVGFAVTGIFKSCSQPMTAISRVEVDGKYGIGRGADNLILPASFDSISPDCVGNQWIIYDKASGLQGLAYVTDSVSNCISPSYSHVKRLSEGAAVLSLKRGSDSDVSYHIAGKGTLASAKPYEDVRIDSDGIMRAIRYGTDADKRSVELYDFSGRRTTDRTFFDVRVFSDGVAWANVTYEDNGKYILSLIDKNGNVLFSKKGFVYSPEDQFSEGLGWLMLSPGRYIAVDKSGKELFKIEAAGVWPFTMGLAPVEYGRWGNLLIGFVDKEGKTVIPFKYKAKTSELKFSADSTVSVSLNGVDGKLHRNGTFFPDNR